MNNTNNKIYWATIDGGGVHGGSSNLSFSEQEVKYLSPAESLNLILKRFNCATGLK